MSEKNEKKANPEGWPFKVLAAHSEWPMHGLVLQAAASVINLPSGKRKQAAMKNVERFFRAGARLATEFGLDPGDLVTLARMQVEREIPGAKAKLAALDEEEKQKLIETATSLEVTDTIKAALADASKKTADESN